MDNDELDRNEGNDGQYVDSSESSSFYDRQGSVALFSNSFSENDSQHDKKAQVMQLHLQTRLSVTQREKKMGHGEMRALDKFKNLLNKEF